VSSAKLSLGREGGSDGSFHRQASQFRRWVGSVDEFPVAGGGRYHLYVARACPWAHRTIIGRRLMGLEDAIGMSFVDPVRDERGWAFTGERFVDDVNGFSFLSEAYRATDPSYEARVSVPVLWDREGGVIVNNESADIFRMLHTVFAPLARHPVELYPVELRTEIDALNESIYDDVNNAVYKAGFARRQDVYEREVASLFAMLDSLDARLGTRRFLFGDAPVETDWRLFTTLVRFDAVYQIHFKCSVRKLVEYESLWPYARDLYQWPRVAETVSFDEIRAHYYRTHPFINPSGLVAVAPAADFGAPHGREAV
jgi:putative glutathione S-transferase